MKTHLQQLQIWIPDLLHKKILDVGSGSGSFLIAVAKQGGDATGVEVSDAYIQTSRDRAAREGVAIHVLKGVGESLPFSDQSFDFINVAEVLEHVADPKKVLQELYRVLALGGEIYLSVPNRFGFRDQHFGVYAINWLPRFLAPHILSLLGKHKDYGHEETIGLQRLDRMHYFTRRAIMDLCQSVGFRVIDLREDKIQQKPLLRALYRIARFCYFDSFHLRLQK